MLTSPSRNIAGNQITRFIRVPPGIRDLRPGTVQPPCQEASRRSACARRDVTNRGRAWCCPMPAQMPRPRAKSLYNDTIQVSTLLHPERTQCKLHDDREPPARLPHRSCNVPCRAPRPCCNLQCDLQPLHLDVGGAIRETIPRRGRRGRRVGAQQTVASRPPIQGRSPYLLRMLAIAGAASLVFAGGGCAVGRLARQDQRSLTYVAAAAARRCPWTSRRAAHRTPPMWRAGSLPSRIRASSVLSHRSEPVGGRSPARPPRL